MKKLTLIFLFFTSSFIVLAQNMNDSLLYQAVVNNDTTTIKELLSKGANVNFVKQQGWAKVNPLITAINKQNIESVKILLQNGADVNWEDGFNTTALMYAASNGNISIIKYLLEGGADIKHKDKQGNDAISTAKQAKHNDVVKLLEATLKERK